MRQLGPFKYLDLKEFTKWDSGCETSGEGRASARQNFGCDMSGWNGGGRFPDAGTSGCNGGEGISDAGGGTPGCNGGGGIPDAGGRPGVMAMEEFRIQGDVRVEWRREEFWMRYVRME